MRIKANYFNRLKQVALVLFITMICGCATEEDTLDTTTSVWSPIPETDYSSEPATAPESSAGSTEDTVDMTDNTPDTELPVKRANGERFDDVIILEGMEETVHYEHIRNDSVGIEMDYDYESFTRTSDSERECLVSVYDDPAAPENYLEVTYSMMDADSAAAEISAALSEEYEIYKETYPLDHAGDCIRIDASAAKGGKVMPEHLQMVYIIPADDGSRIATAHYAIEASEGFGRRFSYIVKTIEVIDRNSSN